MSLSPSHFKHLRASGLTEKTIEAAGFRSSPPMEVDRLSPTLAGCESALEIPYPNIPGFSRYRIFWPDGYQRADGKKPLKYFQPQGSGVHLYIQDLVRIAAADPTIRLAVAEGEKKALCLVQNHILTVGLGGVDSWVNPGTSTLHDEFSIFAWVDRPVEIIFDAKVWSRPDMVRKLYALSKTLESKGAIVSIPIIPPTAEGGEQGVDDYIVANGIDAFKALKRIDTKHKTLTDHRDWFDNWKKSKADKSDGKRSRIMFPEVEPWSDQVDGDELLYLICRTIARFVVGSPASHVAQALWTLHTYMLDACEISPFLLATSPIHGSGKTLRLRLVANMAHHPLFSSNITGPAVFRVIEKYSPTLITDEADTFFGLSDDLQGIFNASHSRDTAQVIRTKGEDHEPEAFSTWSAKAIGLLGAGLPPTIMSRSIILRMVRKTKKDAVERLSQFQPVPEFLEIRQKCARWAADNMKALAAAQYAVRVDGLSDRPLDNWTPLIAIGQLAGGKWFHYAKLAALCLDFREGQESIRLKLLVDIKSAFETAKTDRLSSIDLVARLKAMEDRPWSEFGKGNNGITPNALANLLNGFEIKPRTIRDCTKTSKGYLLEWFAGAFEAYLDGTEDGVTDTTPETGPQPSQNGGSANDFKDLAEIFAKVTSDHATAQDVTSHTIADPVAECDGPDAECVGHVTDCDGRVNREILNNNNDVTAVTTVTAKNGVLDDGDDDLDINDPRWTLLP